jgi:hypothetical protein
VTGNWAADVFTTVIYGGTAAAAGVVLVIWAVRGGRHGWRRIRARKVIRRALANTAIALAVCVLAVALGVILLLL